jgi:PhnB protein
VREPADQPYGSRMAGVLDPFGYKWWIGTQIKNMSVTEVEEAVSTAQGTV